MFCYDFLNFSKAVFDWGSTKTHLSSVSQNRKGVGCSEGCKTPKYELCKGGEEGEGRQLIGRGRLFG